MKSQVNTITTDYYGRAIDVFDIEKMLDITRLPVAYDMLYVTLVVMHYGEWEQEVYEINGALYVTLVIEPAELSGKDFAVLTKDKLRKLLGNTEIEMREMEEFWE